MAGRINTKFVVILAALIVGLAVVGVWALLFAARTSAQEDLSRGLALLKAGNVIDAKEHIGKAVRKGKNDPVILGHYIDVLEQMPSKDLAESTKNCDELRDALAMAVALQPDQAAPLEQLARFYINYGRGMSDSASGWDRIYSHAGDAVKAYPNNLIAQKYRGLALVNRMRSLDVRPDDRKTAEQDLRAVLAKTPDDLEVQYHLALWSVLTARSIQDKEPDRAAQLFKQARDMAVKFVEGHADDIDRMLSQIRIFKELKDEPLVATTLSQIEATALAHPPDSKVVADIVAVMLQNDQTAVDRGPDRLPTTRGVQRSEALVRAALKIQPRDLALQYVLGQLLQAEMDNDGAIAAYRTVQELKIPSSPIDAHLAFFQQRMSLYAQGDLLLGKLLDKSIDPKQQTALSDEVNKIIDFLKRASPDGAAVNALLGKQALVDGQWAKASKFLDQASAMFHESNPEVLMLAARACEGQGDLGAAIKRLETVAQRIPKFLPARYELVRLNMQIRRPAAAEEHRKAILEINPRDRVGLQWTANMLTQQQRYEEAIDLYQRLDPVAHPELAVHIAGVYFAWGKKDKAREVLAEAFQRDPKNLQVLKLLVDLTPDKKEAMALIERSRAVISDKAKPSLNAIQMIVEGQTPLEVQLGAADGEPDPLRKALLRHSIFMSFRKTQEAAKELAVARGLAPDNFDVLQLSFDDALRRSDFNAAQQLVARATALNADAAQGNLYAGRLAMAQEKYAEAAAAFQRAVNLRPTHSDSFVLLGDAQRRANLVMPATDAYRTAVRLNPASLPAMLRLAEVLDARDQYFEALATLRAAVVVAPKNDALVNQYLAYEEVHGDIRLALQFRRDRGERNPTDGNNLRALAVLLGRMNNYPEARQVMDRLIASEGKTPVNLTTSAMLRYQEGAKDDAIKLMADHIKGLGDQVKVEDWMTFARFLFAVGETDQGTEIFHKAIALEDKKEMVASRELGDLLFDRREYSQALVYYRAIWDANIEASRIGPRYAETLMRSDKIDDAKAVLAKVKADSGETAAIVTLEGLIAWSQNDLAAAERNLRKAVNMAPDQPMLHYQAGEFLINQPGRQSEAAAEFQRALALDPRYTNARMALVQLALRQHDGDEAMHQLLTVLHWNPMFLPARQILGQLYLAKDDRVNLRLLLDESAKLFPKEPAWSRLRARLSVREGKYDEAIKSLQQALPLSRDPQIATELALAFLANKQADEAMKLLASPSTSLMMAAKSRAHFALKQNDLGKASLTQAVEMSADYNATGEVVEQAVEAVGSAQAIDLLAGITAPKQVVWVQLFVAGLENEQSRFDAALRRLQSLTQIPDGSPEQIARDRLTAVALAKTGKFAEARAAYERILKTDPRQISALNNLGYLLIQHLNDVQQGLIYAQQANDLAPDVPELVDTLGWGQFKQGNKEAETTLRKSFELRPTPSNCYHLAEIILQKGGSKIEAMEKLEKAKALADQSHDPEFKIAAEKRLAELTQPMR